MDRMRPKDWVGIHFSPNEKWGIPEMMSRDLVLGIAHGPRKYTEGRRIYVHCGCEPRVTGGWHPSGNAVDLHVEAMHWLDQYLLFSKFDVFNGIGIYPFWHNPGLHVDDRPYEFRYWREARWMAIEPVTGRQYDPITCENVLKTINYIKEI